MSLNTLALSGNLGADAELRCTKGGSAVLTFSLAVTERMPNGDGTWGDRTGWVDCTMFGDGSLIALDDLVEYRGRTMQVVAMSHKRKVALRVPGQTRGAYWAHAERCQLVKRHGSINRETKGN